MPLVSGPLVNSVAQLLRSTPGLLSRSTHGLLRKVPRQHFTTAASSKSWSDEWRRAGLGVSDFCLPAITSTLQMTLHSTATLRLTGKEGQ